MAVTCLFPEFSQASFYGQAPLERGKPRDVVLLDVRVAESRGMTYARLNIPFPSSVSHQRRWNRGGSNGVPLLPACTGASTRLEVGQPSSPDCAENCRYPEPQHV